MYAYLDYSSIIVEEGKEFLFDAKREARLIDKLNALQDDFKAIVAFLQEHELPVNRDNVRAVAYQGGKALFEIVKDATEKEIARLKVPAYLAEQFRRSANEAFSHDVWQMADGLALRVGNDEDGLSIRNENYIFKGGEFTINADAVRERIRQDCRVLITDEMKMEAEKVLELAKAMRELELTGVNCIELATRYAKCEDTPARASLFRDICFRRHLPGQINADLSVVFNEVASRAPAMKN